MSKGKRKWAFQCEEHKFSFTPLRSDLYLKQAVLLSFCVRKKQVKSRCPQNKNKKQKNCCSWPIFNKDKNYATNSFILLQEQQLLIENSQKLKIEHECKVYNFYDEKSMMLVPKPKTRYLYCNVCRMGYQDYLEHISTQTHKNSLNKSKITSYIRDLEKKYEGMKKMRKVPQKQSQTLLTSLHNNQKSSENFEQFGKPSKKVKMSSQSEQNQMNYVYKPHINTTATGFFPMQPYGTNIVYYPPQNHHQTYQIYSQLQQPMQMFHPVNHNFGLINPYNYCMNCMMLGRPCYCWNPHQSFYSNLHYNHRRPQVIDLQQRQY